MSTDEENEKNLVHRKVYVLPDDLVQQILRFQKDRNLPSEVEAVRQLLTEALLGRDTAEDLLLRVYTRLKPGAVVTEVAKEVLIGHPLVEQVRFPDRYSIEFHLKEHGEFRLSSTGTLEQNTSPGSDYPSWSEYIPF